MIKSNNFTFKSKEGIDIYTYKYLPDSSIDIKGVVQIAHGMAETAKRYERFALKLTESGYIVYIHDQRGHGKTAKTIDNLGYLADKDGFHCLVEDLQQLTVIIKKENPNLPIYLLGHSMGSFVAQIYIMTYGEELAGAILSGSNKQPRIIVTIGKLLAAHEVKKNGRKSKSVKLNNHSFGSYNNAFKPNRTEFDWLSRDTEEVDKYINDPYCGTIFTAGFYYDFFIGLKETINKEGLGKIPKNLPIYIFSGDKDPVGNFSKGILKLVSTYKKLDMIDVSYKLYKDGRHEMLNEINRDEVAIDIINWLNNHNNKRLSQ